MEVLKPRNICQLCEALIHMCTEIHVQARHTCMYSTRETIGRSLKRTFIVQHEYRAKLQKLKFLKLELKVGYPTNYV